MENKLSDLKLNIQTLRKKNVILHNLKTSIQNENQKEMKLKEMTNEYFESLNNEVKLLEYNNIINKENVHMEMEDVYSKFCNSLGC